MSYGTIEVSRDLFEKHDYTLLKKIFEVFNEVNCTYNKSRKCFEYYGYSELFHGETGKYYVIDTGDGIKFIKEEKR